jgi:hypothetical protein
MTEGELQTLRLKARLEVLQVLIRGLYTGLANISPNAAQGWRNRFAELRKEHAKIAIPGVPSEYSDLIAAEYQEALEDSLSNIESGFHS